MPGRLPIEHLEEQRGFCLHNFSCAMQQVFDSEPGTTKRKKGLRWAVQAILGLEDIEELIEEAKRAAVDD